MNRRQGHRHITRDCMHGTGPCRQDWRRDIRSHVIYLVAEVPNVEIPIIVMDLKAVVRPPRNVAWISFGKIGASSRFCVDRWYLPIVVLGTPDEWFKVLLER